MMHQLYFDPDNLAATRTALEIDALSPGWRQSFTDRIEQASGG